MSFLFLSHWGCFIHPPPPQEIQQKSSLINAVVPSFATKMISWGVSFYTSSGRMTIWERGHSTPLITSLEITLDTIRNPPPSLEISSYSAHLLLESRILDLNLQKWQQYLIHHSVGAQYLLLLFHQNFLLPVFKYHRAAIVRY